MSRTKNLNSSLPKPIYTLDLHGSSKSEAISRTTGFLERSNKLMNRENAWVLVVTGSGAHSLDGPVLRGAVEALLIKRKIEYYPMKGKGSFLVNAASGFVLYEPKEPRDSKVIVASNSISVPMNNHHSIRHSKLERENREGSRKALKKMFHNRCKEEVAFDEAILKSLEEKDNYKAEDQRLLERAVDLSLLEKHQETQEEKNIICAAIEISKRESIVNAIDEDACLQRAIDLSRMESKEVDIEIPSIFEDCTFKAEQDQENEGFLKALELSVVEF